MSTPYLAEIRIFTFPFAPKNWADCNGQLLAINQNQALFSLLGTTYGGNGVANFGLPDLQARIPIHVGQGHTLGERGGEQAHTLSISEIPTHVHSLNATEQPATDSGPDARQLAKSVGPAVYGGPSNLQAMAANAVTNIGGSQAHSNMQPYLTLRFCIALAGIFPSQT